MGIEVPRQYGGAEMNFMSSIIAIEGRIQSILD